MTHPDDAKDEDRRQSKPVANSTSAKSLPASGSEMHLSPFQEVESRIRSAVAAEYQSLLDEGCDPELEQFARNSARRAMSARVPTAHWFRPLVLLGGLAASALCYFFWPREKHPGDPTFQQPAIALGIGEVELISPRGDVEAYTEFRWHSELPQAGQYELRIFDAQAGVLDPPIFEITCEDTSWEAFGGANFPAKIRWEVISRGARGEVLARASAEAQRAQ